MATGVAASTATVLSLALIIASASAHGSVVDPPCRGCTNGYKFWPIPIYAKGDKTDNRAHFPAGDKSVSPGAGLRSQIHAAGYKGWMPYEPTKPGFKFRTGPCGDALWQNPGDHVKGGKYYNGGKTHKVFNQGGQISIDIIIIEHHNGFSEFRLCDAYKCGGDITNNCLRDSRKCRLLERAHVPSCESRYDKGCGPIDLKHPERWYHPCRGNMENDFYGNGKMVFKLPSDFYCNHCVLQWHWTAANSCNPPGVIDYFQGAHGPKWGNCKGQGGAVGGFRSDNVFCGGGNFAEEYVQCSDIKILSNNGGGASHSDSGGRGAGNGFGDGGGGGQSSDSHSANGGNFDSRRESDTVGEEIAPITVSGGNNSEGRIEKIGIYADGEEIGFAYSKNKVVVDMNQFNEITFTAHLFGLNNEAKFFIDGDFKWTDHNFPYVMFGNSNRRFNYWWNPIFNSWLTVEVESHFDTMKIEVLLQK